MPPEMSGTDVERGLVINATLIKFRIRNSENPYRGSQLEPFRSLLSSGSGLSWPLANQPEQHGGEVVMLLASLTRSNRPPFPPGSATPTAAASAVWASSMFLAGSIKMNQAPAGLFAWIHLNGSFSIPAAVAARR